MGITGLLPLVKNACRQGNITELKGKSVALDVSCLLHKGLVGCMDRIHLGESTTRNLRENKFREENVFRKYDINIEHKISYINFVEKHVAILLALGCHVVIVFDGRPLPAKKSTNDDRRDARAKNIRDAEVLMAKGKEKEARDKFRLATSISADVVHATIKHFSGRPYVDVIVAPYEADAQLAYLVKAKLCDAVITEDSDLIVFGCEKIYFKWQNGNGDCLVYEKDKLPSCFTAPFGGSSFDFVKFRRMCILAGCDYLQAGLPGVGLVLAQKAFAKTSSSSSDLLRNLRKIPTNLNNPKLRSKITKEFCDGFVRAEETFLYQVIFDPRERCQKTLNPLPTTPEIKEDDLPLSQNSIGSDDIDDLLDDGKPSTSTTPTEDSIKNRDFAGVVLDQRSSVRLACGNQIENPSLTDSFLPPSDNLKWSVWSDKFESKGRISSRDKALNEPPVKSCGGAFMVEGPGAKKVKKVTQPPIMTALTRKRPAENEIEVILDEVMGSQPTEVPKKKTTRDENDYSSAEMMNIYKKKKITLVTTKSEVTQEEVKKEEPTPVTASPKKAPPVRKSTSSPAKFVSPLLSSAGRINAGSPRIRTSPYFVSKPSVSNPFRKPVFKKPTAEVTVETDSTTLPISENSTSTPDLPEMKTETEEVKQITLRGFRAAGLRRNMSK